MGDAVEVPQPLRPEKKSSVDADTQGHSTTQAVAVTKVLDDDNLLREIIVRVGFPTTLVRAALVCKRWFGHASDPKLLSRFRKLHPPRLLGYYLTNALEAPRFVPMLPQAPELATVIRRVESYSFGADSDLWTMDCRNGNIFTRPNGGSALPHVVHRPLCPERSMDIVPPLPSVHGHNRQMFSAIISKEEGSSLSYLYLLGESTREAGQIMARVYLLQDGVWHMHTSIPCQPHLMYFGPKALLMDNNIYVPTCPGGDIIVFDLTASNFSTIQVPQGVSCEYDYISSMLSRADDASSVYFIHVEEFQLRIWLHKGDNWLLVDNFCLHQMLNTLGIPDHTLENEDTANVQIEHVGDNGQFVFLRMWQSIFYLDMKCRTLCKVYENTVNDQDFDIHPFMMMWPPTFPALKDDRARFSF